MTQRAAYIKTNETLTVTWPDGKTNTLFSNDSRFGDVYDAIRQEEWGAVRKMLNQAEVVKEEFAKADYTSVRIEDGIIYYEDEPVHNALTDRILRMIDEGFNVSPMIKFLKNLMENPSFRAVNELYDFLEASELPITEDGNFIAYKRVRADYTDIYSGTFDNSPGKVVEIRRNMVDEDKNRTCSKGLHFCSREYLPHYGNGSNCTTMMVEINPRDVVAIPADYGNSKGRCCRYKVVKELEHRNEESLEDSAVVQLGAEDPDYDSIMDWNQAIEIDIEDID